MFHAIEGGNSEFFLGFTHSAFQRRFTWIHLTAGPIDFASTETAHFSNQENLFTRLIDDKHQCRADGGLPVLPVRYHKSSWPMQPPATRCKEETVFS